MTEQRDGRRCRDQGQHRWSPTALYVDGVPHIFCLERDCRAEAQQTWVIKEGPGLYLDGELLDIEDDPDGGVAKIVLRECLRTYGDGFADLRPDDTIIDIGAHVGVVSIFLAKRHPETRIFAFEPEPTNYRHLVRNLRANGITNVRPHEVAVAGEATSMVLSVPKGNSGGPSAWVDDLSGGATVKAVALADVFAIAGTERVRLLKIDCEGAEHEVLTRGIALLDRVDYLAGEFHANPKLAAHGYSPERLLAECQKHIAPDRIRLQFCRMGDW